MTKVKVLTVITTLSVIANIMLLAARPRLGAVTATNANSRPTYFSVHRIGEAQRYATGRGVKIGVIDHYFGFDTNRHLYGGGADFLDDAPAFRTIAEHGLWMTRTAKEIAPGADIFALNATCGDEERKVSAMVRAIEWAIAHRLDILTYSGPAISLKYRPQLDTAVARATTAGINCVFTHYPHPLNLLPFPMLPLTAEPTYERAPDVNVYHYDYNVLLLNQYLNFTETSRGTPPYLSVSSTSVVAGGVVALLRELDRGRPPGAYKEALIATSRHIEGANLNGPEVVRSCDHTLDALAAVMYVRARKDRGV